LDRHVRQRTLAAVGDSGQQRICEASYSTSTPEGVAASIEREYLERAGARHFIATGRAPELVHAQAFQHAAARDFATGAWRALLQLRRALEQTP
jgi:hypothetical protein